MHDSARRFVERHADPSAATVEFGARNVNGGIADLFYGRYCGVDVRAGDGVDVVADAATFQIVPRWGHLAEQVVCCEVLEHAPNWQAIVENGFGQLGPGGRLIVTCATDDRAPHGVDGGGVGGEWYRNVPAEEFVAVLFDRARFEAFEVDPLAGDLRVVAVKR